MPPTSMPTNNYKKPNFPIIKTTKTTNINSQEKTKVETQTTFGQSIKNSFAIISVFNIMNILLGKNKVIEENTCKLEKINLENCINNHTDCSEFMEALKRCQTKN